MIIGPYCHNFVRNRLFTGICYYFGYKVYILINIVVAFYVVFNTRFNKSDRYRLKSAWEYFQIFRCDVLLTGRKNLRRSSMGQWYRTWSGMKRSISSLWRILLSFRIRNKSMRDEELSVKWVGSVMICLKLYWYIRSFNLLLSFDSML